MINPGMIYLFGSIGLYFIKDKLRSTLAIALSLLTLFSIWNLSLESQIIVPFLNLSIVSPVS